MVRGMGKRERCEYLELGRWRVG